MRKRTAILALSGVVATGAAGAVAITPASAATSNNPVTSRLGAIKDALSGLVSDGTLTQQQADKVASTLEQKLPQRGGPGHFGAGGFMQGDAAAAKALGMTTEQLRSELRGGKSLAEVAKSKNVSVDTLVKAMVDAAQQQLATAVKDGKLTQQQADTISKNLTQRITDRVNAKPGQWGPGHRRGPGHGFGGGPGGVPGQAPTSPAPAPTA